MVSIQDLWSGKTSPVRSVRTKAKTSEKSSKASAKSNQPMLMFLNLRMENGRMQDTSWQMISPSHGEFSMLSIGEFPKEESVSTLSQILQANLPEKYYLSQKACLGISKKGIFSWKGTAECTEDGIRETGSKLVFENHSQNTGYTGPLEKAPTVGSTYGIGGNNQPFVVEDTKCFDVRFTSEETKNVRHNCYETDTSRTIDTGGNASDSNQGGVEVVSLQGSMIGRKDENGSQGDGINEDVSLTLNATDKHAVVYAIDREAFNCGQRFARTPGINNKGVNSTLNA